MTDTRCGYPGDRDEALIAYLYDDVNPIERASMAAHLATCARCSAELDALRGVRAQLTHWAPPDLIRGAERPPSTIESAQSRFARWHEMPVWAQAAAAMLVLGVSAGIANLNVHYDHDGLTVRTGWSKASSAPTAVAQGLSQAPAVVRLQPAATTDGAPWRSDLAALERQLRSEFRASAVGLHAGSMRSPSADDEIVRRVRALIEESERKERSELALRVAEVLQDVRAQRNADLAKIDRTLGVIQDKTGVELLKQRADINYLAVRASQRQ